MAMTEGPMIRIFLFFLFTSMTIGGLAAFLAIAMVQLFGADEAGGNLSLSVFMVAMACAVLLGGVLADRISAHDRLAAWTVAGAAATLALLAFGLGGFLAGLAVIAVGGFLLGVSSPSRDLIVRASAPAESLGLAFGFVSTGLSIGFALGPITVGGLDGPRPARSRHPGAGRGQRARRARAGRPAENGIGAMIAGSAEHHRAVWRLSVPIILSNISVPLLGAVDTAVVGHLPEPHHLGAVALGSMVFNFIYWGFGFLRMGTAGLTAQAHGAGNSDEVRAAVARALMIAGAIALVTLAAQTLIVAVVFDLVEASADVEGSARVYVLTRIWGAPAALSIYVILGWFLGLQNTRATLYVQLWDERPQYRARHPLRGRARDGACSVSRWRR